MQTPARKSVPLAFFIGLAAACVLFGTSMRIVNGMHKIFYQDEAVTAVRASGYMLADESALFDGRPHAYDDIQRLMRPAPGRGAGATLRSLAVEDPQHPPAFYVFEAFWTRAIGSGPFALRAFAIVCGLLALPLAYALALELFVSRRVALLALAFFAISPFFVLYGYQAREYGFFATVTLLSTLLYVRAQRLGRAWAWIAYAASVALGMYVYLLFAFVVVAHACAAAFRANASRRSLFAFAASALVGVLLAVPWLAAVVSNARSATDDVSWATSPYPVQFMIAKWLFFASASFFDIEFVRSVLAIVAAGVLAILAYATVICARDRTIGREVKALVFALGGTTFVCLALADLFLHHRFSTIARYLTPSWIALLLIVASALGERLERRLPRVVLAVLVACAVASDIVSARSTSWWENSGNKSAPALASYLTAHPGTLIVRDADSAPLLVIAALMPPGARWLGYGANATPQLPPSVLGSSAYLLSPLDGTRAEVARSTRARMKLVYDSHDFGSELTRVRAATFGERAGQNDWGELVLWSLVPHQ